ncbi:copper resistance protein NlpE [Sinomicrobium sp.]
MKKTILNLVFLSVICFTSCKDKPTPSQPEENAQSQQSEMVDMHNAENALDYYGVYEGVIPCADCEGIKLTVDIKDDNSFKTVYYYLGKSEQNKYTEEGSWKISESTITFSTKDNNVHQFFVGEGFIQMLDQEGNKIEDSSIAEMFILKKVK